MELIIEINLTRTSEPPCDGMDQPQSDGALLLLFGARKLVFINDLLTLLALQLSFGLHIDARSARIFLNISGCPSFHRINKVASASSVYQLNQNQYNKHNKPEGKKMFKHTCHYVLILRHFTEFLAYLKQIITSNVQAYLKNSKAKIFKLSF